MIKLILTLSLLFVACGSMEPSKKLIYNIQYSKDTDLSDILKEYKRDKKTYLGTDKSFYNIRFKFVDKFYHSSGKMVKGSCARGGQLVGNNRLIRFKKSNWDSILYHNKRLLVYHELGHCDLDLEHYGGGIMQESDLSTIEGDFSDLVARFFNLKTKYGINKIAQNH